MHKWLGLGLVIVLIAGSFAWFKGLFAMPSVSITNAPKGGFATWTARGFSPLSQLTLQIGNIVFEPPVQADFFGGATASFTVGNNLSGTMPVSVKDTNGKTGATTFTVTS